MARLLDTKIRWKDRFGKYHCAKAQLTEEGWSLFPILEVNLGFGTDESSAPAEADHLYPGDTVKLQSGGPLMTVLEVTKNGVRCGWFLGKDNQEGTFPAGALYKESPAWRGKKAGE